MKKYIKIFSLLLAAVFCANLAAPGMRTLAAAANLICYKKISIENSGYSDFILADKNGNEFKSKPIRIDDDEVLSTLPAEYDLRDYGLVTSVKNQGEAGSCWAFAPTGAIESVMIKKGIISAADADYSEAFLVWFAQNQRTTDTADPTYGDGVNDPDPFNNGGNWMDVLYTLARGSGVELEENYPFYSTSDKFSLMNYDESKRYSSYARLMDTDVLANSNSDVNNAVIKTAIYNGGAVSASYFSNDQRYNLILPKSYYQSEIQDSSNHAIMIVGWDDSFAVSNFNPACRPTANGAWLCRNSWGSSWGSDGYFWISYQEPSLKSVVKFDMDRESTFDNIYQYDGAGWNSIIGINGVSTVKAANVFTSERDETLTHVSFSTYENADVSYSVNVYTDVDGTANPENGTVISSAAVSGTTSFYGYHTVELSSPVELTEGQKFSVVVTMTDTQGNDMYVPVESDDSSIAASSVGCSYANFGGTGWYDTSDIGYNNVSVKAMTSTQGTIPAEASIFPSDGSNTIVDAEKGLIYGLTPGMTADGLISSVTVTGNAHIETTATAAIGTGTIIRLVSDDEQGTVLKEYYAIVFGDINGDGAISASDMTSVKSHIAQSSAIASTSPSGFAADLNGDSVVNVTDYTCLKAVIAKSATVNQSTGRVE